MCSKLTTNILIFFRCLNKAYELHKIYSEKFFNIKKYDNDPLIN